MIQENNASNQNVNGENNCDCRMCGKWGWCPAGKGHKIVGVVVLVLIVMFVGRMIFGGHGYGRDNISKDTITVNGKGELTVKPDIALISFSITEENLDVSKASDVLNTKMADIVANLKTNGVDEKDIKTTDYSINPRYDYVGATSYPYNQGKRVLASYEVTQGISLKIRDLKKAGKIISDLAEFNVTNMSGLTFTNDKYDDLVKQARDEAIVEARSEAKKLAKSLGVRLVKITAYSEGGNYPIYYDKAMSSVVGRGGSVEAVIPTGENKITASVSITYEIR